MSLLTVYNNSSLTSSADHFTLESTHEAGSSISQAQSAIETILPEILERASQDTYFHQSLMADTKLTINALLSASGAAEPLPDFLTVKVFQDSPHKMHLLIPTPYESLNAITPDNPLMDLLVQASRDDLLKHQLENEPKATLERELSARSGSLVKIPDELEVIVVPQDAGTVAIVLPETTRARMASNPLTEAEWDLNSVPNIEMNSSCYTCNCFTGLSCFTGQCHTSGCYSFSQNC